MDDPPPFDILQMALVAGADKADRRDVALTPVVKYEPDAGPCVSRSCQRTSRRRRVLSAPEATDLYLLANKPGREHRGGDAARNSVSEVG